MTEAQVEQLRLRNEAMENPAVWRSEPPSPPELRQALQRATEGIDSLIIDVNRLREHARLHQQNSAEAREELAGIKRERMDARAEVGRLRKQLQRARNLIKNNVSREELTPKGQEYYDDVMEE